MGYLDYLGTSNLNEYLATTFRMLVGWLPVPYRQSGATSPSVSSPGVAEKGNVGTL
jgi:hypothetical protein